MEIDLSIFYDVLSPRSTVLFSTCKDELIKKGEFNIPEAKPLMHLRGKGFVVAERVIEAEDVQGCICIHVFFLYN